MDNYLGITTDLEEEKQIFYSVVLTPNKPDYDGDIVTVDKIEELAHDWLAYFRKFDMEHDFTIEEGIEVVESYLTTEDRVFTIDNVEVTLEKGTWVVGIRVNDLEIWNKLKSGEIQGVSIAAFRGKDREVVEAAFKSKGGRVTLDDLGEDYFVPLISLVRDPAVLEARVFALKNKNNELSLKSLLLDFNKKLTDLLGGISKKDTSEEVDLKEVDLDMTEEQLKEFLDTWYASKISEDIDEEEVVEKSDDTTDEDTTGEDIDEDIDEEVVESNDELDKLREDYDNLTKEVSALKSLIKGSKTSIDDTKEDVSVKSKPKRANRDIYGREIK